MIKNMHERDILALPMTENDANAENIGQFIMILGEMVIVHQEGFSGKRPFGNSGWIYVVYEALVAGGVVEGTLDEDGYLENVDREAADEVLFDLFTYLKNLDFSKLP